MLAYTLVSILGLAKEKVLEGIHAEYIVGTVRSSCFAVLGYWVALFH